MEIDDRLSDTEYQNLRVGNKNSEVEDKECDVMMVVDNNYASIVNYIEDYNETKEKNSYENNANDEIDDNTKEIILNTSENTFYYNSNEIYYNKNTNMEPLNERKFNDYYKDILIETLNENYFNKCLSKNSMNYEDILFDFWNNDVCDEKIYNYVISDSSDDDLKNRKNVNLIKKEENERKKKKKKNNIIIKEIHFKSLKQNYNYYFVPVLNILMFFFNYKKNIYYESFNGLFEEDDSEKNDEERIFRKFLCQKICIEQEQNKISISDECEDENKPYVLPKNKGLRTYLRNSKKNKINEEKITKTFFIKQNPYCCKDLLYNQSSKILIANNNSNVEEFKNILKTFFLGDYPNHLSYFNFNFNSLMFYNLIDILANDENILSNFLINKISTPCNLISRSMIINEMIKNKNKYVIRMLYITETKNKTIHNFLLNEINNKGKYKKKKSRKRKNEKLNDDVSDIVNVDKQKESKFLEKNRLINFNEDTIVEFIKTNKNYKNEKKLYRLLSNSSDDSENEQIFKKESEKIQFVNFIYSKNYEISYFTYILYEYYYLVPYYYHFAHLADILNDLIKHSWNLYQLLFFYYQLNYDIYIYAKCLTQLLNMFEHFFVMIKDKEHIDTSHFNCFYRNKYEKKKKKILYKIKIFYFIFQIFYSINGAKYKTHRNLYFYLCKCTINTESVIFHRKYFTKIPFKKYLMEMNLHLKNIIKRGRVYLKSVLENIFNINKIKKIIASKMKHISTKLGNLIKRSYADNDYIHSYVLSVKRNMMFHIMVLNVHFFLINFKGTVKLVEKNYSTFIDNYHKKFNEWDEHNFNNNVFVLSVEEVKKKKKHCSLSFSSNMNEKLFNKNGTTKKDSGHISSSPTDVLSFFMRTQKYIILKKKAYANFFFKCVNFDNNKNNNTTIFNNENIQRCINYNNCLINPFQLIKNNSNFMWKNQPKKKKPCIKYFKFLEGDMNEDDYMKHITNINLKKNSRSVDINEMFSVYINIIFEFNKTKKQLPYLFNYTFISSNLINNKKSYFLCHDKSDIINDCVKNIFKDNYEVLHNTYLSKILKCENALHIKKQLKSKHMFNFFSNLKIFRNYYYKVQPKIIECFLMNFLNFFRKYNKLIKNPDVIFFLYYWRSCSDLIKKNKLPVNNLFIDQKLAENIFYSFFLYFCKRKFIKNELIKNKINIINYIKLFKYILSIEHNLLENKGKIIMLHNNSYDRLFYKKEKYMNNKYSLYKKIDNTMKISFKSRVSSIIQNIDFSTYNVKNIRILDIYKSFMKLINNLKNKENNIDITKMLYFHMDDKMYLKNEYEKEEQKKNNEKEENRVKKEKKKVNLNFLKNIFYSIMIDNFINNNKQFFLIKKLNFFEEWNDEFYRRDTTNKDNDSSIYNEDKGNSKTPQRKKTILKYVLLRFFKRNIFDEFRKNHKEEDSENFYYNIFYRYDHIHNIILKKYINSFAHFIEPVDCINIFNTKIYKNLNHLFSNIPLNFKTYSYLKHFFNKTLFNESIEKIDTLDLKDDIIINNKKDITFIDKDLHIKDEENEEFMYISTDIDSYKSDTVHNIKLNKINYVDFKKYLEKNEKLLKIAMKEKPYCKLNKCFSSLVKTYSSISLFHDCYKIYANMFHRLNDYFQNDTYLLKILDEYIFEWHNNLNMYDPFLFLHNKCYNFRKIIKQRKRIKRNSDAYEKIFNSYYKNKNSLNKNYINEDYEYKEVSNMCTDNISIFSETKNKNKNENEKENKMSNSFYSCLMKNTYKKKYNFTKNNLNFEILKKRFKDPYLCIYNDSSYYNVTNTCIEAEINKNDKYEELLINYNLNRNVHFEFNSNLNCFILRLKNDYIKRKNKSFYLKIKKNQIYKLKFIQNLTYTKKYTYFLFSCFVYTKFQIIRMMYLFSLRYFPSLFLKTVNYLNYLKLDEKFLELLYCDDYEILNSIFYNYTAQKNYKTIFDILRFKGYHINPFSLLGSVCYIKEIKIICKYFKLQSVNYFNTLHSVVSIDNIKNELELKNLENFIYKQEMNKNILSEFNELPKKETDENEKESCLGKINLKKKNRKNNLKLCFNDLLYNNLLLVEFSDNLECNIDNKDLKEFFNSYNGNDDFKEIKNFESNISKIGNTRRINISDYFINERENMDQICESKEFDIEEIHINEEINQKKRAPRLIIPPTLPNVSCVLLKEKKKNKEKKNFLYLNKNNEKKEEEEKSTELYQYIMQRNETNAFNIAELYKKKRKVSTLSNRDTNQKKRNINFSENNLSCNEINMNTDVLNEERNEILSSEYILDNNMDNNYNINSTVVDNKDNNINSNEISLNNDEININNDENNIKSNELNINNNEKNINNDENNIKSSELNINNNEKNINNDENNMSNNENNISSNDININSNEIDINNDKNNINHKTKSIQLNGTNVEKGNKITEGREASVASNIKILEEKKKKKKKKKW